MTSYSEEFKVTRKCLVCGTVTSFKERYLMSYHRWDTFLGVILQTQSEENAVRMREWLISPPKESQRRMIQKAMRINNGEGPQPLITIEE